MNGVKGHIHTKFEDKRGLRGSPYLQQVSPSSIPRPTPSLLHCLRRSWMRRILSNRERPAQPTPVAKALVIGGEEEPIPELPPALVSPELGSEQGCVGCSGRSPFSSTWPLTVAQAACL